MSQQVTNTATLACSFGLAPSMLTVLPTHRVTCGGQPAANVNDHVPMLNILPFGMCTSLANPTVASATTAALGVLTPMPCVPVTTSPWIAGAPTVPLGGMPTLNRISTCLCIWAGVITIQSPGQVTVQVPP